MKKEKYLSILIAAALLAGSVSACGTKDTPDTAPEISDGADTAGANAENGEPDASQPEDATDAGETSDTDVTSNAPAAEEQTTPDSPVTVTFQKSLNETKADDGTVIHTASMQMPVVSMEGAEDIAEKINADIAAYYDTFSNSETISMAEEDYAASLGEDGWDFLGYSSDISAKVTRADDAVLSFEITFSDYTGGAHGNYGTGGRNYSTKTGELIAFDDISEDYEAFHATALDYMLNLAETPAYQGRLFGIPSKDDMDSALFTPESWVFTLSGISFLSNPYVLGPYSSGTISFMLPYEKAYELGLKEDYRYNGNFVNERYYIETYNPETGEQVVEETPDYYFDLDGDGTEEGLAFYGQVVDPATGESRYAFYIDGKDYGDVIKDSLPAIGENGYLESTYALYHTDAQNGDVPAFAVLLTVFGEELDSDGNPINSPCSYVFSYTKEKGLNYLYRDEGFVTLPKQP